MKTIHFISGVVISIFIGMHLFNHAYSVWGAAEHIALMKTLRLFYRNIFFETILFIAVAVQMISGFTLFRKNAKVAITSFDKLQRWSGLYLAVFFVIHLSAVTFGRYVLKLDTNLYFGAAGLNAYPFNLFFIPYYGLAIIAFFSHFAAIHAKKMKRNFLGVAPVQQAQFILLFGLCCSLFIFYGLTNHFKGIALPVEYNVLLGR